MIEGAVIAVVSLVIGVVIGRIRPQRRRQLGSGTASPVCGCGHHQSFHDPATGECHGENAINVYGRPDMHKCGCRQYLGPVPLPEYFAPEVLP